MNREQNVMNEIERIRKGGPQRNHEKLKKMDKLFVRDRLRLYFGEDNIYYETGTFANVFEKELPNDGIITGAGKLDDRLIYFTASDFTVKAGSIGKNTVKKFCAHKKLR